MPRRPIARQPTAASLVEVLVVTAVIALLLVLVLPQLSAARIEGWRLKCVANLKELGKQAANNSVSDSTGALHPRAINAPGRWVGLGSWDFGGQDGACGEFRSGWPRSPDMALGAAVRPFNIAALGPDVSFDASFAQYQCPADVGVIRNPNYEPRFTHPAPCSEDDARDVLRRSVFEATGTSYQGDFLWVLSSERHAKGAAALRFGPFLRPQSTIPNTSETLLFYEARFPQALMSAADGGAPVPVDVPGWHGRVCEFNAVMSDGHAQRIRISKQGDAAPAPEAPPGSPFLRGLGWRYDCLPEAPTVER